MMKPAPLRLCAGQVTILALAAAAVFAPVASAASCASSLDSKTFSTAEQLRADNARLAGYGLRLAGTRQHDAELAWLTSQLKAVPGLRVRSRAFSVQRWMPTTATKGRLDLVKAGSLTVGAATVPVAGAVAYSLPTPPAGVTAPLTYVPRGEAITAVNAAGRIVVTEVPSSSLPYAIFGAIKHYLTPGLPLEGKYERPYLATFDQVLIDAGKAGAAGVVFVWDVPGAQVRGYFDPHSGTRFRVPAVFVGGEQAQALKTAGGAGTPGTITVRARWDRARTRDLFATLAGRSKERVIVLSHTDGSNWVQENGPAGVLALARAMAKLPQRCRQRTIEIALTSGHLGFRYDSTYDLAARLDRDYDRGTVAFAVSLEHLGSREILPSGGATNELRYTGQGELIGWSVGEESKPLVDASIAAVKRRRLARTAVVKGIGVPTAGQAPSVCSFGGIGSSLQARLIPGLATITGPWSLWAPSFGERAVDFKRMRTEVLAQGDVIRALDRTPRATIAGNYLAERRERKAGTVRSCPSDLPVAEAPVS